MYPSYIARCFYLVPGSDSNWNQPYQWHSCLQPPTQTSFLARHAIFPTQRALFVGKERLRDEDYVTSQKNVCRRLPFLLHFIFTNQCQTRLLLQFLTSTRRTRSRVFHRASVRRMKLAHRTDEGYDLGEDEDHPESEDTEAEIRGKHHKDSVKTSRPPYQNPDWFLRQSNCYQ